MGATEGQPLPEGAKIGFAHSRSGGSLLTHRYGARPDGVTKPGSPRTGPMVHKKDRDQPVGTNE